MAETGFIVEVPEAQSRVGALRDRFDAGARLGVPAHVTILFPFMAPDAVDGAVLQRIRATLAKHPAFDFTLARVGRFPETSWLAPEPAAPFVALTEALAAAFPAFPPFGGAFDTVIPHLTVAHGDAAAADRVEHELGALMRAHGPIRSRCVALQLLENSSGRWRVLHRFPLAPAR